LAETEIMSRTLHPIRLAPFALASLLAAQTASAIVTVGPDGSGCRFNKIQDAIDYVVGKERNAPDDVDPYIGVAGDNFYNEALVIDSSGVTSYIDPFGQQEAFVQIYGNYDQNCDDVPIDSTASIGAGGGRSGNSVLEVKGSSAVRVVLNHFVMTDGNVGAYGGGINFHASAAGYLDLSNVDITGNQASYGGGIFVDGHAPGFTLALHAGTTIENNTASNDGGGLYATGETFLYAPEGSVVFYDDIAGSNGGGLSFQGHGSVNLGGVQIFDNRAGQGGGIYVDADDPTDVNFYDGVVISVNTAEQNGGGVRIGGQAKLYAQSTSVPTQILFNQVVSDTGSGGGVDVRGPAQMRFTGSISNNLAGYGGGISAYAGNDSLEDAYVSLAAANPTSPVSVSGNSASHIGGGIYVKANSTFTTSGDDYIYATVCAQDFLIDGNSAAQGTAIYADSGGAGALTVATGSSVALNGGAVTGHIGCPAVARACASGVACNEIRGNHQSGGSTGDGSTILLQDHGNLSINRATLQDNQGAHVLHVIEDAFAPEVHTVLMTDNQVGGELIHVEDGFDDNIAITDSTLAHNSIGAAHVIRSPGATLLNTIVAEDVAQTMDFGGNDEVNRRHFYYVLTNPADATLATDDSVVLFGSPSFVDVAGRDYHLAPFSQGLDVAPASDDVPDLDKNPRNVDLTQIADFQGPRDLGPYELPFIPSNCAADAVFCDGFDR
jgi:predicted outer membrane repeat protein